MRYSFLAISTAILCSHAAADSLSDVDREAMLERLQKIQDSADSRVDARFRTAITAFRSAMQSDQAALELYLNCVEKVNYTDQLRKAADFREWKKNEGDRLGDPGFKLALRYQLRWLMLTLEGASENADRLKLAAEAEEIMDTVFREPLKLKGQEGILSQGVTSSIFAQAYSLGNVKVRDWPTAPIDVETTYENLIFPPLRQPSSVKTLRAKWMKRIQLETIKAEHWGAREDRNGQNRRVGMSDSMRSAAYMRFLSNDVPELQWDMETDLYKAGDQRDASVKMLAILEKNISHSSAPEWAKKMKALLSPAAADSTPPPPPVEGTVNAQP